MKITPKLLIGKCIKDSNKISEAEKINMLAEIMYLNEAELDAWIEMTLIDESGVLNSLFEFRPGGVLKASLGVGKLVGKAAGKVGRSFQHVFAGHTEKEVAAMKKARSLSGKWDKIKSGAKELGKKAELHPVRAAVGLTAAGYVGAQAVKKIADKLNVCKSNCREAYKETKDKEKFSICMEKCQNSANSTIKKVKEQAKAKRKSNK